VTNQVKTIPLLGVLSAVLVAFGGMLGPGYLYFFTGFAVLVNLGAYFSSDRIVLAMHRAREVAPEAAPRLHAMVEELAITAELPKPRVFLIEDPHANAFAAGRSPNRGVVAVTTGVLGLLIEPELRGVLAHELGRIKNRDILIASIAAGLASALTHTANVIQFSALFGGSHRPQEGEDGGGSPSAGCSWPSSRLWRPRWFSSGSRARGSTWPTRRAHGSPPARGGARAAAPRPGAWLMPAGGVKLFDAAHRSGPCGVVRSLAYGLE